RTSNDVWTGAIARLQVQVSLNTSMLDTHRRQVADIEHALGRLQHEMSGVVATVRELSVRPLTTGPPRHDPADLDVIASQLSDVTNRVNEIDGFRMQMELLKNRMRRFEE
ncbi:hypothetical protein BAUCODRAFT_56954, partial [Baudoinia panamericana UAMH 10762]